MSKWRPEEWSRQTDGYFHQVYRGEFNPQPREIFEAGADAMLEAVCVDIEKVGNPYYSKKKARIIHVAHYHGFERARRKILTLLK